MISINEIQAVLADTFLDGNTAIAGIVMYLAVLMLLFALFRDAKSVILLAMPVSLVFSYLGMMDTSLMLLLIIVCVLALATEASGYLDKR